MVLTVAIIILGIVCGCVVEDTILAAGRVTTGARAVVRAAEAKAARKDGAQGAHLLCISNVLLPKEIYQNRLFLQATRAQATQTVLGRTNTTTQRKAW